MYTAVGTLIYLPFFFFPPPISEVDSFGLYECMWWHYSSIEASIRSLVTEVLLNNVFFENIADYRQGYRALAL